MNFGLVWKLLPDLCKLIRWIFRRKPTNGAFLIVEDDPHDAKWLQQKLQKRGRECELASSAEVCIGAIKHTEYRCIFVDLRLPGMSGQALLQALSEDAPNAAVIIVCGEPADLATLKPGQLVIYIAKPVSLEAIEDALRLLRL